MVLTPPMPDHHHPTLNPTVATALKSERGDLVQGKWKGIESVFSCLKNGDGKGREILGEDRDGLETELNTEIGRLTLPFDFEIEYNRKELNS